MQRYMGTPCTAAVTLLCLSALCLAPPPPASVYFTGLSPELLAQAINELNSSAENILLTNITAGEINRTSDRMDSVAQELIDVADDLDNNCCNGQPYRDEAAKLEASAEDARIKSTNLSRVAYLTATQLSEISRMPHTEGVLIDGRGFVWHFYNATLTLYNLSIQILAEKQSELQDGQSKLQEAKDLLSSCSCSSSSDDSEAIDTSSWTSEDWESWMSSTLD